MTPKHRYGLRILPDCTTENQRPWFVINIQWFAKEISELKGIHKKTGPLTEIKMNGDEMKKPPADFTAAEPVSANGMEE